MQKLEIKPELVRSDNQDAGASSGDQDGGQRQLEPGLTRKQRRILAQSINKGKQATRYTCLKCGRPFIAARLVDQCACPVVKPLKRRLHDIVTL